MKRQATDWEMIFAQCTANKELASRIQKELLLSMIKKKNLGFPRFIHNKGLLIITRMPGNHSSVHQ